MMPFLPPHHFFYGVPPPPPPPPPFCRVPPPPPPPSFCRVPPPPPPPPFCRVPPPPPPPPFCRVPPPFYTVPTPPPPPFYPLHFYRVHPPPPPPPPPFYDVPQSKNVVFISFRGDDTLQSLTSHLYEALRDEGILTFERGHKIWPDILKAIERSWISIVIFSEGYASSRWCLEELVKILVCKKKYNQIVIPIFYKVDLSDVKDQTGTFADAFAKHEVNFKEKVHKWRDALREATNIPGFDSKHIS